MHGLYLQGYFSEVRQEESRQYEDVPTSCVIPDNRSPRGVGPEFISSGPSAVRPFSVASLPLECLKKNNHATDRTGGTILSPLLTFLRDSRKPSKLLIGLLDRRVFNVPHARLIERARHCKEGSHCPRASSQLGKGPMGRSRAIPHSEEGCSRAEEVKLAPPVLQEVIDGQRTLAGPERKNILEQMVPGHPLLARTKQEAGKAIRY